VFKLPVLLFRKILTVKKIRNITMETFEITNAMPRHFLIF